MLAEHQLEKAAGQFVVLQVRIAGVDGDRALTQPRDQFHQMLLICFGPAAVLLAQARAEQPANAEANQEIGQQAPLEQPH